MNQLTRLTGLVRGAATRRSLRVPLALLLVNGLSLGMVSAEGIAAVRVERPGSVATAACPDVKDGPKVRFTRTSTPEHPEPGQTVAYRVTVRNEGGRTVQGATFTDNVSRALDDSEAVGRPDATGGEASYARPRVTWHGDLAVGAEAVVTYKLRLDAPATGDGELVTTYENTGAGDCEAAGPSPAPEPKASGSPSAKPSPSPSESIAAKATARQGTVVSGPFGKAGAPHYRIRVTTRTRGDQRTDDLRKTITTGGVPGKVVKITAAEDSAEAINPAWLKGTSDVLTSKPGTVTVTYTATVAFRGTLPRRAWTKHHRIGGKAAPDLVFRPDRRRAAAQPYCEDSAYVSYGTHVSAPLRRVDLYTGAQEELGANAVGGLSSFAYGVSSVNGHIYGANSVGAPKLYDTDPSTRTTRALETTPALPKVAFGFGAVNPQGEKLYLRAYNDKTLYVVDVDPTSADFGKRLPDITLDALGSEMWVGSFNPADGKLYGLGRYDGKLYRIDPAAGTTTALSAPFPRTSGAYDAMWFDNHGTLYTATQENPGWVHQLDLSASSPSAPIAASAVPEAMKVTRTAAGRAAEGAGCLIARTYGDGPAGFGTASHLADDRLTLGAKVFSSRGPVKSAKADGTPGTLDAAGGPSDDGVDGKLPDLTTAGSTYTVEVKTTNTTGSAATLAGWADFDGDGSFEAGERTTAGVANGATTATLNWAGISGMRPGRIVNVRLRLFPGDSSRAAADPQPATASDRIGETEDYRVMSRTATADRCRSYVYVSNGSGPTDLRRFEPSTGTISGAIPNTRFSAGYDGIGYSPLTGKVYGMQTSSGTVLVEIDPEGIDPPKTHSLSKSLGARNYDVGAVTPEGDKLVVFTGHAYPLYTINLDPTQGPVGKVDSEFNPTNDDEDEPYDFAFHPKDKMLYGIGKSGYLLRYDLRAKTFGYSHKINGSGVLYYGQFFDNLGNLYAVNSQSPQKVWTFDLTSSTAAAPTPIAEVPKPSAPFGVIPAGVKVGDAGGCLKAADFGDAPDSYRTLHAGSGPSHAHRGALALGAGASTEPDARQPLAGGGLNGLGDTLDDGVTLPEVDTTAKTYTAKVRVKNDTGAKATLAGWIDWNANGSFDAGELTRQTLDVGDRTTDLTWTGVQGTRAMRMLAAKPTAGDVFARFRLYPGEVADPQPTGDFSGDGEVEDWPLTVHQPRLRISKTIDKSAPLPGERVKYTVTVENRGATAKSGIEASDDLSGLLDDAVYNADAAVVSGGGTVSFADRKVTWKGDLAAGAKAVFAFTATVKAAADGTGDHRLDNRLLSETDGSNCQSGSTDPGCSLLTPLPSLVVKKRVVSGDAVPGGRITYRLTITNDGEADYPGARVTDALAGVTDDARYNGDAALGSGQPGTVTYASDALSWAGTLPKGESAEVTYSATVDSPPAGDRKLLNAVTATGSNCPVFAAPGRTPDPDCSTSHGIASFAVHKSVDNAAPKAGDTLTYTITMRNDGIAPMRTAAFSDDLGDVVDDAPAGPTAITIEHGLDQPEFTGGKLTWSGALPTGTTKVTYQVVLPAHLPGNQKLVNAVTSDTPGSECRDGTGSGCRVEIAGVPELHIAKSADQPVPIPGKPFRYQVVLSNNGSAPYRGAAFTDDLADVLKDANGPVPGSQPDGGRLTGTGGKVSYSGTVEPGRPVEVWYEVTVPRTPKPDADGSLVNTVVSTSPGSNCRAGSRDDDCSTTHAYGALQVTKEADRSTAKPGDTVTYTVTLTNRGAAPAAATVKDSLTEVLDDAELVGAPSGGATVSGERLGWTGEVRPGTPVVITYRAKLKAVAASGADHTMRNSLVVDAPGSPCTTADPCTTTTRIARLHLVKTADRSGVQPGDTVTYRIKLSNSGTADYTGASFADNLGDLLDLATGGPEDITATLTPAGSTAPDRPWAHGSSLFWNGTLPKGGTLETSYRLTLKDTLPKDARVTNTVISAAQGSNCPSGSAGPECTVDLSPARLSVSKAATPSRPMPGGTVKYTITLKNDGGSTYRDARFADDLAGVLDDGTLQPASLQGGATQQGSRLTWAGDLAAGAEKTFSYEVKLDRITGADADTELVNRVSSSSPGAVCTDCTTTTKVPRLKIKKTADRASAKPGERVTYTVTAENTGTADWKDAVLTDDVSELVDGAEIGTVPAPGVLDKDARTITWTSDIAAGQTVTYRYPVEVKSPASGSGTLDNSVSTPAPGSNCDTGSSDAACRARVDLQTLTITKTSDLTGDPKAGTVVRYTVQAANHGRADYTGAEIVDALGDVLDDADYNDDARANLPGTLDHHPEAGNQGLTWKGDVPAGRTLTLTYSVTVLPEDGKGNDNLRNLVLAGTEGTNCEFGTSDANCQVDATAPRLTISKAADKDTARPGEAVTYTVTVKNPGTVRFPDAEITDPLRDVLDDASFDKRVSTDGTATDAAYRESPAPAVVWRGDVPAGASFSFSYRVVVDTESRPGADHQLLNTVRSSAETNCAAGSTDPRCGHGKQVEVSRIRMAKSVSPDAPAPGSTATYTLTLSNSGRADYPGVRVTDDLRDVLSDADLVAGSVRVAGSVPSASPLNAAGTALDWTGTVKAGTPTVITYQVKIPANRKRGADGRPTGDLRLANTVVSDTPGANCPAGGADPDCTVSRLLAQPELSVTKTANPQNPQVGERVVYEISMRNTGRTAAADLEITDAVPSSVEVEKLEPSPGSTAADARPVVWKIPSIAPGDAALLRITGRVKDPAGSPRMPLRNIAKVTEGPVPTVPADNRCEDSSGSVIPGWICDDGANRVPAHPELTLTKAQTPEQPQAGSTVVYSVKAANAAGADPAERVEITDLLPEGLDLVRTEPAGVRREGRELIWGIGGLAAGAEETMTVTAKVRQDADPARKLVNRAWASAGPRPSVPVANRCADAPTRACSGQDAEPPARPELVMEKKASPKDPQVGEKITYTVTVHNKPGSPAAAEDLEVVDRIPEGIDLLAVSADRGSATTARPVVWSIPTLGKGDTATLTVTGRVNRKALAAPALKNSAELTEGPRPEIPAGSRCTGATGAVIPGQVCDDTVNTPTTRPELSLSKSQSPAQPQVGSLLTYTLTLGNAAGADAANRVRITDVLPDGVEFVSARIGGNAGTADHDAGTVVWNIGPIAPDKTRTLTVVGKVKQTAHTGTVLTNRAGSTGGPSVTVPVGNRCPDDPEQACAGELAPVKPEWKLSKSADPKDPQVGEAVTYTVSAENTGTVPARDLRIEDELPAGLDLLSVEPPAGTTAAEADPVRWHIPELAAGRKLRLKLTALVTDGVTGRLQNGLEVTEGPAPTGLPCPSDPARICDDGDNTAPARPELKLSKTQRPAQPQLNSTLTYTLTLTNSGTDPAKRSRLTDELPDGVDFVRAETSHGTVDSSAAPKLVWTPDEAIPAGGSATATVTVKVAPDAAGKPLLNKAWTTAGSRAAPQHPCPGTESDKECAGGTPPSAPSLELTKTADPKDPQVGERITYVITVRNKGTVAAKDLAYRDVFPAAVDLLDSRASTGLFDRTAKVWTVPEIPAGEAAELTLVGTVTDAAGGSRLQNSVEVVEGPDPTPGPGSACTPPEPGTICDDSSPDVVRTPKLTLDKTGGPEAPQTGSDYTYTLRLANSGDEARRVEVTDQLPAGVRFVRARTATGSAAEDAADPRKVVWKAGTVGSAGAELKITVRVDQDAVRGSVLVNKAETTAGPQAAPAAGKACPGADSAMVCHRSEPVAAPELSLRKTQSQDTAQIGVPYAYTITLANAAGADPARNLTVRDTLPPGVEVIDAEVPVGTADWTSRPGTVLWDLGAAGLKPGGSADLVLTVKVGKDSGPHGRLTNRAEVATGPEPAVAPGDQCPGEPHQACVTSANPPVEPKLTFTKTVSPTRPRPGATMTYTVTATNGSEAPYQGALFSDSMSGVTDDAEWLGVTGATAGAADYRSGVLNWHGRLDPKETAKVSYRVKVPLRPRPGGDGRLLNRVVSDLPGSNCPTDSADSRCATGGSGGTGGPDGGIPFVTLAKSADRTTVLPGGTVRYTVMLTNAGPGTHKDYRFTDDLKDVLDDTGEPVDLRADRGRLDFDARAKSLAWTGDVPAARGSTPGTVEVIYRVKVPDPVRAAAGADRRLVNRLSSAEPGADCTEAAPCTTATTYPNLRFSKTMAPARPTPGQRVVYTVKAANDGTADYHAARFSDDLTEVLKSADYNGDATGGAVYDRAAHTLRWTGDIPAGGSSTITYSVTVDEQPRPGEPGELRNAVVSDSPGSNCRAGSTDPACGSTGPYPRLRITKTADNPSTVPGGTVRYTVTVANSGRAPYRDVTLTDDLTGVLDDADYDGNARADHGAVAYSEPELTWTGTVPARGTAVITYSATLPKRLRATGDQELVNTAASAEAGSNCRPGAGGSPCTVRVPIASPAFLKSADKANPHPGETVTYTVKVLNTGRADLPAATFTDDLSQVLDDARWAGRTTATAGRLAFDPKREALTWTGPVRHGGEATAVVITYQVALGDPPMGDTRLRNTVSSDTPGSNCPTGDPNPECVTGAVHDHGASRLRITNEVDKRIAKPGEEVRYTVRIKNTGTGPFHHPHAWVPLYDTLDSADLVDGPTPSRGTASVEHAVRRMRAAAPPSGTGIVWKDADPLKPGEQVVIRHTVRIKPAAQLKPGASLANQAHTGTGSNCNEHTLDETGNHTDHQECTVRTLIALLRLSKTVAGPERPKPGDRVTYTVTLRNTGSGPYLGASLRDDLSGVLDDASLDGRPHASSGRASYLRPVVHWTGDVPAGGTVTVRYTLIVRGDRTGDGKLLNRVVSESAGSNCRADSPDRACSGGRSVESTGTAGSTGTGGKPAPEPGSSVPPKLPQAGPAPAVRPGGGWLPGTGADDWMVIGLTGLGALLAACGVLMTVLNRRRRPR